jgi:hypothetical protein
VTEKEYLLTPEMFIWNPKEIRNEREKLGR